MIKTITSRDNKYLRYVRKLGQRKYRDREGKYLIEGENLILEALSGAADIEKIIIRSGTAFEGSQAVLEHADISVSVPGELFDELTDTETSLSTPTATSAWTAGASASKARIITNTATSAPRISGRRTASTRWIPAFTMLPGAA